MFSVVPYIGLISWAIQWIYPLWMSCRILRGDAARKEKMQGHWVVYWVFCALFSVIETVLRLDLIPMYFELKALLFFWLVWPKFSGASWVWHNHAEKFFPLIDDPLQEFLNKNGLGAAATPAAVSRDAKFDAAQEAQEKYLKAAKAAGIAPSGAVGGGSTSADKKD